jgi:hypothetical protein
MLQVFRRSLQVRSHLRHVRPGKRTTHHHSVKPSLAHGLAHPGPVIGARYRRSSELRWAAQPPLSHKVPVDQKPRSPPIREKRDKTWTRVIVRLKPPLSFVVALAEPHHGSAFFCDERIHVAVRGNLPALTSRSSADKAGCLHRVDLSW